MSENFPNLGKRNRYWDSESPGGKQKDESKIPTARYVKIKLSKIKNKTRILKASREKLLDIYERTP